jgi:hypothetical protein
MNENIGLTNYVDWYEHSESRDSSVGIALGYSLDDRVLGGWEFFSSPPRPERLWGPPCLLSPIQWVPGALSLGVKRPVRETDHSPPSSAEVKNAWSYTATPPVRLHGVVLS